jgi:hypothetical protein
MGYRGGALNNRWWRSQNGRGHVTLHTVMEHEEHLHSCIEPASSHSRCDMPCGDQTTQPAQADLQIEIAGSKATKKSKLKKKLGCLQAEPSFESVPLPQETAAADVRTSPVVGVVGEAAQQDPYQSTSTVEHEEQSSSAVTRSAQESSRKSSRERPVVPLVSRGLGQQCDPVIIGSNSPCLTYMVMDGCFHQQVCPFGSNINQKHTNS